MTKIPEGVEIKVVMSEKIDFWHSRIKFLYTVRGEFDFSKHDHLKYRFYPDSEYSGGPSIATCWNEGLTFDELMEYLDD